MLRRFEGPLRATGGERSPPLTRITSHMSDPKISAAILPMPFLIVKMSFMKPKVVLGVNQNGRCLSERWSSCYG